MDIKGKCTATIMQPAPLHPTPAALTACIRPKCKAAKAASLMPPRRCDTTLLLPPSRHSGAGWARRAGGEALALLCACHSTAYSSWEPAAGGAAVPEGMARASNPAKCMLLPPWLPLPLHQCMSLSADWSRGLMRSDAATAQPELAGAPAAAAAAARHQHC